MSLSYTQQQGRDINPRTLPRATFGLSTEYSVHISLMASFGSVQQYQEHNTDWLQEKGRPSLIFRL
jgi:hypothetical protein